MMKSFFLFRYGGAFNDNEQMKAGRHRHYTAISILLLKRSCNRGEYEYGVRINIAQTMGSRIYIADSHSIIAPPASNQNIASTRMQPMKKNDPHKALCCAVSGGRSRMLTHVP
jgi:hypothetical protein